MKIAENNVAACERYLKENLGAYYSEREIALFADILFEDLLNITKNDRFANHNIRLSESQLLQIIYACKDLKQYKPVQYITEKAMFGDFVLKVNQHVLIPRPETEELVSIITKENKTPKAIIDFCTGSGCIALSLKKAFSSAKVFALDVSAEALKVAKENASNNNLHIDFVEADVLNVSSNAFTEKFDIVVSNPPYVLESDKKQMDANVLKYEPHLALFVNDDEALLFYNAIAPLAYQILNENGKLYFEIHEGKGEQVRDLLLKTGFTSVSIVKDFYDKDRFVLGQK